MIPLVLLALAGSVRFPMSADGRLGVFRFFETDVEHFVYAEIAARVTPVVVDPVALRLGLDMETYMGESWNNPDMKFNIYGGHWNISLELAWLHEWGELRLYTDHECFHNIDMPDTLSEYMNNIKLGGVLDPAAREGGREFEWLPDPYPSGWLSLGLYRPRGESFQKGHDFDWSVQTQIEYPFAAAGGWDFGTRWRGEFFVHQSDSTSARHRVEAYARHHAELGDFEVHLTHYPLDTQPFRRLDGETCAGIRFIW